MTPIVRWIPGTTREANIALAQRLAAVGIFDSQIGWVDIGATYGLEDSGDGTGDALFEELFGS